MLRIVIDDAGVVRSLYPVRGDKILYWTQTIPTPTLRKPFDWPQVGDVLQTNIRNSLK